MIKRRKGERSNESFELEQKGFERFEGVRRNPRNLSDANFLPLNKRLVDSNECVLNVIRSPLNIWLFVVPQIACSLK